jgi:hypothetical protein
MLVVGSSHCVSLQQGACYKTKLTGILRHVRAGLVLLKFDQEGSKH